MTTRQHGAQYWTLKPHLVSRTPELVAGFADGRFTTEWPELKAVLVGTIEWAQALSEFATEYPAVDMSSAWADHNAAAEMIARREIAQTGTPVYMRFGKAPKSGYSTNGIDGSLEVGVSVYEARKVDGRYYLLLTNVDAGSALFIAQGRQAYIATGTVAGKGSDGEPCLTDCKLRKLADNIDIIPVL